MDSVLLLEYKLTEAAESVDDAARVHDGIRVCESVKSVIFGCGKLVVDPTTKYIDSRRIWIWYLVRY